MSKNKTLKVGVTGGIGSGKTTICKEFESIGINVFYTDEVARNIIDNDSDIISQIKDRFGEDIYQDGKLDRPKLSSIVFKNHQKLLQLNTIVHPPVMNKIYNDINNLNTKYAIIESAIFYESGYDKDMDKMIFIYAPRDIRIDRVMRRNNLNRQQVIERMSTQNTYENNRFSDANLIIHNYNDSMNESITIQVKKVDEYLRNL